MIDHVLDEEEKRWYPNGIIKFNRTKINKSAKATTQVSSERNWKLYVWLQTHPQNKDRVDEVVVIGHKGFLGYRK